MYYTVTRIIDSNEQVYDSARFSSLNEATSEADKPIFVPFSIRVVVEDDDGNVCYRASAGGR